MIKKILIKKVISKKCSCLFVACIMAASIAMAGPAAVMANTAVLYQSTDYETAVGYENKCYDVYVENSCQLGVGVLLPNTATAVQRSVSISLVNEDGSAIGANSLTNESQWENATGSYFASVYFDVHQAGSYRVQLSFSDDVSYGVLIGTNDGLVIDDPDAVQSSTPDITVPQPEQPGPTSNATLSTDSLDLAEGCSRRIKVIDGNSIAAWKSSKPSVATVSNGKILAKKAGSCTISATVDGKKLTCSVTVRKNVLSGQKTILSDAEYGVSIKPYKASFNNKGDLVIKATLINNTAHQKVYELRDLNAKVKTKYSSIIGVYKRSKQTFKLNPQSQKDFTMIIKKKHLRLKSNVDLRTANVSVSTKYAYK